MAAAARARRGARRTLLGTAIVIFVFRAMPGPGAGSTWWMIDELGFDQSFLSQLSLIASVLTLAGLFLFRRFMAERSIAYIVGFLTSPARCCRCRSLGMYYGLHEWTAAHTGGVVDARFIADRHRARVAARPDRDGADAGLDRQLGAGEPEGDLLRGDGLVHQPRAVGLAARHQVPEPDLRGHPRGPRPGDQRDQGAGRLRVAPA
jgi:hypothetical protein